MVCAVANEMTLHQRAVVGASADRAPRFSLVGGVLAIFPSSPELPNASAESGTHMPGAAPGCAASVSELRPT